MKPKKKFIEDCLLGWSEEYPIIIYDVYVYDVEDHVYPFHNSGSKTMCTPFTNQPLTHTHLLNRTFDTLGKGRSLPESLAGLTISFSACAYPQVSHY